MCLIITAVCVLLASIKMCVCLTDAHTVRKSLKMFENNRSRWPPLGQLFMRHFQGIKTEHIKGYPSFVVLYQCWFRMRALEHNQGDSLCTN